MNDDRPAAMECGGAVFSVAFSPHGRLFAGGSAARRAGCTRVAPIRESRTTQPAVRNDVANVLR